jgi:hypothetical protein
VLFDACAIVRAGFSRRFARGAGEIRQVDSSLFSVFISTVWFDFVIVRQPER